MLVLPLSIVIDDISTTGSAVVDGLGKASVMLYDLFGDFGSFTINTGS